MVTSKKIDVAETLVNKHMGGPIFNRAGWEYILKEHNGFLPIEIKAVPEGTLVPVGNVLMTVENTDDNCFWLTNYLETLLCNVWYPCTVATQSHFARRIIQGYLDLTGDDSADFKLHDFGMRGVTCPEQAGLGGAAHLLSFKGTDNFAGIEMILNHYDFDNGSNPSTFEMPGFSIPASEHSTITSWGKDNELDAFTNMLEQYPTGLVACVSDSYNVFDACKHLWGDSLKDAILGRAGTLVVRPDSGEPNEVLPKLLDILWDKFGGTTNAKGYKVLDPHVRLIQGDGIDIDSMNGILFTLKELKWSADNIAFGSGGGLLQKMNRDTQRFAFKCSEVTVDGKARDVFKSPSTDSTKDSKRGRLKLIKNTSGNFETVSQDNHGEDILEYVFDHGNLLNLLTFDEVRKNLNVAVEESV